MDIFLLIIIVGAIFFALNCLLRIAEASEETADAIVRIVKMLEAQKQRRGE